MPRKRGEFKFFSVGVAVLRRLSCQFKRKKIIRYVIFQFFFLTKTRTKSNSIKIQNTKQVEYILQKKQRNKSRICESKISWIIK
jgi:hypothetical protein